MFDYRVQRVGGTVAGIVIGLLALATTAPAQDIMGDPQGPAQDASGQSLWNDFLHYVNIARPKLARSYGQALLDRVEPKDIYLLSTQSDNTISTLRRGEGLENLQPTVQKIRDAIEKGYKTWRSDPEQIEASIQMMGGTLRGYAIGKQRLKESAEYAIPLLIQKLLDPDTPAVLRERIVTMMHIFGRDAVRPYTAALQTQDIRLVGYLANALGQIEYPSAIPRLREVLNRKELQDSNSPVRRIVVAAIISCAGGDRSVLDKPIAELFASWGFKYYDRADSLLPDPRYPKAFVWFWKKGTGLEQIPVPKEILTDIYAMRYAREALRYDSAYYPAVPLWLSAAIRRQSELPEGQTDPLWGDNRPDAAFYALASPPRYLQAVLAMALKDESASIATEAIGALSKTAGPASLVKPVASGSQPLVAAMGYPDRNVRFLAAETLALAMPTDPFEGSPMVLMLLNEALRQKGQKYALLVAENEDVRNTLKAAIRSAGFEVIEQADVNKLLMTAQQATALDAVVVGPNIDPRGVINRFRGQAIYTYLPMVVIRAGQEARAMSERDGRLVLLPPSQIDEAQIAQALDRAIELSAGKPLSEQQASQWAIRAARAIEKLGVHAESVFDLTRSQEALIDAASRDDTPDIQIAAADALATINTPTAQQALARLALSDASEPVRIAAFQAATRSVRRFANHITDATAATLTERVAAGDAGELGKAAAQLLGALNLPIEQMPALIETTDDID